MSNRAWSAALPSVCAVEKPRSWSDGPESLGELRGREGWLAREAAKTERTYARSAASTIPARLDQEATARDAAVRQALYVPMASGTKDEKIGLARVLARSGDSGSVAALDKLSKDPDPAVAQEGLKALRTLQSRM